MGGSATVARPPAAAVFKGCTDLHCRLKLPKLTSDGWIPSGRLWVSPNAYVLFVHSPRHGGRRSFRRRPKRGMRYFIFHEFHNATRNTDLYDTISSHRRSVFVPFYLGKQGRDAEGHRFVVVVQVAPHDVISRHATNYGSAGPGIEVAKNYAERLMPLQAKAGILVASIVKAAEPRLRIVHHRGSEGRPMLRAYLRRLSALRSRRQSEKVILPFVAAQPHRVALAAKPLEKIIAVKGTRLASLRATIKDPDNNQTGSPSWQNRSNRHDTTLSIPAFAVPAPQPVIRPPAPRLVTFRPPTIVKASPLTMEDLLKRIRRRVPRTDKQDNQL